MRSHSTERWRPGPPEIDGGRRRQQADIAGGDPVGRAGERLAKRPAVRKSRHPRCVIAVFVPFSRPGHLDRRRELECWVCGYAAGQRLARTNETAIRRDRGDRLYFIYRSEREVCRGCPLSSRCLEKAKPRRRVERWEHTDWLDRHGKKISAASPLMRGRAGLVEHPFGTIKRWAGIDHFLMRGLKKCRSEFSLMALGYNFKRMVNELGVGAFREHCLQKQRTAAIGV